MKRYLLFTGTEFEGDGQGGWDDFHSDSDSVDELTETITALYTSSDPDFYWFQIVDTEERRIVQEGNIYDLRRQRREKCKHKETHRVVPIVGDWIVSGASQAPGLYCSDCGQRLGD